MENNNLKIEKDCRKYILSGFLVIFTMIAVYAFTNTAKDTYSASEECLTNKELFGSKDSYCAYVVKSESSFAACTEVLVDTCDGDKCMVYTNSSNGSVSKNNLSEQNPCAGGNNVQNTTNNNPETGITASYILFILAVLAGGYSIYYFNRTSKVN